MKKEVIREMNKVSEKIIKFLKENYKEGLTITELVKVSKLSRDAVRIGLAKLEGAKKVFVKRTGMAKIYYINKEINLKDGLLQNEKGENDKDV